jgi:cytochrome c oxidase cbb3-type subunit 3
MSKQDNQSYPSERSTLYGDTHDQLIQGHSYDGIKEYDNPMPGWWVWIFWICVAFSAVYYAGITWFDFVDTYEDDLAQSQQELQAVRTAYAEANPTFEPTPSALAEYVGNDAKINAGAEIYAANCASCHGQQGGGLIGPNLTDKYWIHGGDSVDIFNILTEGVAAKGMPAWDGSLSPEERAELVAFIQSLEGTDPPNAKDPQGELEEAS